jgi:pentatricopeptide repeat protein
MNIFSERKIDGYPEKSAYLPLLEALFKLGRIEEANDIFDEFVRKKALYGDSYNTEIAAIAKSNGYNDIAETWSKGEPTKQVPYVWANIGGLQFLTLTENFRSKDHQQFMEIVYEVLPDFGVSPARAWEKYTLEWEGDKFRWAFIGTDGLVIKQGTEMPTVDDLKEIIKENGIKTKSEMLDEFLRDNPDHMEALITFGTDSIIDNTHLRSKQNTGAPLDSARDEELWRRSALVWDRIFNHSYALFAIPEFYFYSSEANPDSIILKSMSARCLTKIEAAIHQSPSSRALWKLWLFWRRAGDNEWDFESMLQSVEPSPAELKGACPPNFVLEAYYKECREKERWPQIIALLKEPWERGISDQIVENNAKVGTSEKPTMIYAGLGDDVAFPLIEALLRTGRRQEADGIFNQWLECGGKFANAAALVELARALGSDRMEREWETKINPDSR